MPQGTDGLVGRSAVGEHLDRGRLAPRHAAAKIGGEHDTYLGPPRRQRRAHLDVTPCGGAEGEEIIGAQCVEVGAAAGGVVGIPDNSWHVRHLDGKGVGQQRQQDNRAQGDDG